MDDPFYSGSLADRYGIELGVECAWPSAEWPVASGEGAPAGSEGAPAWDAPHDAQYTVSTGTPKR
jgi:hypothetical protein